MLDSSHPSDRWRASLRRIDVWEVLRAAATKSFGYMPFIQLPAWAAVAPRWRRPIGPGRVRQRLGRSFGFSEAAEDVNDHMPDYVACCRLTAALN
ncbi:MAG: hypothetical protein ACYC1D_09820 [Acidimicrobiales bacterium]